MFILTYVGFRSEAYPGVSITVKMWFCDRATACGSGETEMYMKYISNNGQECRRGNLIRSEFLGQRTKEIQIGPQSYKLIRKTSS